VEKMKTSKHRSVIIIVTVVLLTLVTVSLLQRSKTKSDQSFDILSKAEVGNTSQAQQQNPQPSAPTNPPTVTLNRIVQADQIAEVETEKTKTDPVVMTDYENLTIIADDIQPYEDQSYATGNVGVADRHGMFVVGGEGIITHTNQSGSIDSVYLPGDSSIELPGEITMSSTETEIIQNPDGSKIMRAEKIELHDSPTPTKIIVNGKEIDTGQ